MTLLSWIILFLIPGLIAYPMVLSHFGETQIKSGQKKWIKLLLYIFRALMFAFFWPIIGLLLIIAKISSRNQKMKDAVNEMKDFVSGNSRDDGTLRYWKMGGMGNLSCSECGYSQEIVSFLHGFGEDPWSKSGYQCQKCGKFYTIENAKKLESIPFCDCGGILSREKALFCPKCRNHNVEYLMTLIT